MIWFLGIVVILVLGVAVAVALGGGATMAPVHSDRRDVPLPGDRALRGSDLRAVRFTVGLRGYRTDEVDALLARLSEQLDEVSQRREDRG